jgi:hypothetical protein
VNDDDWNTWTSDYRRSVGPPGPDPEHVLARAQRDSWVHAGKMALELSSNLFALVVFAVLVTKVKAVWPLASVVFVVFAVAIGFGLHVRAGTWRAVAGSTVAYVDLACRRKRAEVRLASFGRVVLAILAIAIAAWLPYFLATTPDPHAGTWLAAPVRVVFVALLLTSTWLYVHYRLARARRALAELERVRASLREEPDVGPIAL